MIPDFITADWRDINEFVQKFCERKGEAMKLFDISEYCAVKGILQSLDSQQWADAFIIAATKESPLTTSVR